MQHTTVRTRFAPSPTGYMHVGGLRTALYGWLLARQARDGKFILRIEDTDQERLVEGATEIICRTLRDAGLHYDEGPDVGGSFGPYVQTERRNLYLPLARELIEKGAAYYCFCDKERLAEQRKISEASGTPHKYDGHCRRLTPEQIREKLDAGLPYVIRQRIPETGATTFHDEIFGDVTAQHDTLDDAVLLKADGLPTYNFANVVDDHLMGITHVLRGSEYLSSTPKYNLLYEAFGWEIPVYIHVSPVMKDATRKLSKRHGDPTYEDLLGMGYVREAVLNYVALLGWSPGGEREMFSLEEMAEAFSISGLSKSPAIFDLQKLGWLSGCYIRAMSPDAFHTLALPYINTPGLDTRAIAALLQERCEKLVDIPAQIDFFTQLPDYDPELYVHKKMKTDKENSLSALQRVYSLLEELPSWDKETIHDRLLALAAEMGVKNGQVLYPLRVALSGKAQTPGGGVEIAAILGKEESLRRIRAGMEALKN